jgi:peptidoglycan/xylan/chitin deacetylase (PgdA/CDA1 family)
MFFIIGLDTEQDVDKKYVHTGEYRNISEGIPKLLDIFSDFRAKPTWFVTPDVAQHCGDVFSELAMKHEVGCHVHPEYFNSTIKGVKMDKILPEFSYQSQLKMIREASDEISQMVGAHANSFRAARFAINMDTLRALESCGFHIDCSMTPFVNWGFHAPTLSTSKIDPYFIHVGSRDILEIPVTIVRPFGLFPAWLRPSFLSGSEMINVAKIRAKSGEDPLVFNMMFHSMELIDPNPYLASKELFDNLRQILEYAYDHGVTFSTMSDFYGKYAL